MVSMRKPPRRSAGYLWFAGYAAHMARPGWGAVPLHSRLPYAGRSNVPSHAARSATLAGTSRIDPNLQAQMRLFAAAAPHAVQTKAGLPVTRGNRIGPSPRLQNRRKAVIPLHLYGSDAQFAEQAAAIPVTSATEPHSLCRRVPEAPAQELLRTRHEVRDQAAGQRRPCSGRSTPQGQR